MALYTVATGNTIAANDIDQLVNVLQQPSGGQEKGKYFLAGAIYGNGALVSLYTPTLTRNTAPVVASCSIDEADQTHIGGINNTPTLSQVSASGFQVYSLATSGPNANGRAGGNYTMQY